MTAGLLPAPSDEQAMLADASVRLMDAEVPLAVIRAAADGSEESIDAYTATAAELGWFGLLADEASGGGSLSGNGLLDAALVASERGGRLQPGPFVGHSVVVGALAAAGGHDTRLAELVAGAIWATWVFDENLPCRLTGAGDALRLDGTVAVVADADRCGLLLVPALGPDGPAQVLVATDAPGVEVRRLTGLDVTRHWDTVTLDGVAVGVGDLVGAAGPPTEAALAHQAQVAAVLVAAESAGAMRADLDMAVAYAKDRVAFGRPIGSFQGLKHLIADASLLLEMAMGAVAAAATALGAGDPDGPQLAHAAKAFVAEHGLELAHTCFQVFGGIGYTWEHDQHLYLRRLAADAELFGSPGWHRRRLLDVAGVAR
jgi:alkylation response protein AidB-like acyl-CoA dehydrogenase